MSTNTKIEWCDHTFNPWEGCQKTGPGCDNCYAEARNARFGGGTAINFGPGAPRRRTSAANWALPKRWNAQADAFMAQHGRRQRVFCASLADVFDNAVDPQWRADLFALIEQTPHLDWLLLTKRIGNAADMMFLARGGHLPLLPNVWIGATVINQEEADRDIRKLLDVPARVRFLSMEPLLGPVSFEGLFANPRDVRDGTNMLEALDWVIVGGESGPNARPMHPDWARSLRDQCEAAGVPFLFKQWGEWSGHQIMADAEIIPGMQMDLRRIARWEGDTAREVMPSESVGSVLAEGFVSSWVGKKAAGRLLDGRTWDGFPS